MRHRNARGGRHRGRASEPRNHGPRDTRLRARDRLLVPPSVDEGVTSLEPHHPLALESARDDHPVDLFLCRGAAPGQLGDVDQLDVRRQLVEQFPRRQPVGAHDIGLAQGAPGRARRAATVTSSGCPGPPPTSTTPGARSSSCGVAIAPSRSPATMASRTPAERRGSRFASTATVTPAWRPTAGVHAVACLASSARTQNVRRCSDSSLTRAFTSGSSVAAMTYHAPSTSPGAYPRSNQVISPEPDSPSTAGVTTGETTTTSAPAAISRGIRRCATWPPPTTRTLRPARRSPEGYGGNSSFTPNLRCARGPPEPRSSNRTAPRPAVRRS